MDKRGRVIGICVLMVAAILLFISEADSWWGARPPARRAARTRAAHHQYVRTHDFNNDGKVDVKDRLRWIREHADNYSTVYITDDDADLLDVMDLNNNGEVELVEMQIFYKTYDINKNGVLEEEEIGAAVE